MIFTYMHYVKCQTVFCLYVSLIRIIKIRLVISSITDHLLCPKHLSKCFHALTHLMLTKTL